MPSSTFSSSLLVLALACSASAGRADCKRFGDIHTVISDMPKSMWAGSFTYETDEAKAYDMWWEGDTNPNDALTNSLMTSKVIVNPNATHFNSAKQVDKCYLGEYAHKDVDDIVSNTEHPTYKPADFAVCKPWKERSCCKPETVSSETKIRKEFFYGLDACGRLSPACEKFYIREACFYECSPNAGLFRAFKDSDHAGVNDSTVYNKTNDDHNQWAMKGMPTKASWWNGFHAACKDDIICNLDENYEGDCEPVKVSVYSEFSSAPALQRTVALTLLVAAAATVAPLL